MAVNGWHFAFSGGVPCGCCSLPSLVGVCRQLWWVLWRLVHPGRGSCGCGLPLCLPGVWRWWQQRGPLPYPLGVPGAVLRSFSRGGPLPARFLAVLCLPWWLSRGRCGLPPLAEVCCCVAWGGLRSLLVAGPMAAVRCPARVWGVVHLGGVVARLSQWYLCWCWSLPSLGGSLLLVGCPPVPSVGSAPFV